MPYYRCVVPEGSVSLEKRQEVATAITDIHCGSTGAPRSFVHVEFVEYADGASEYDSRYYVDGRNRAGRPEDVKRQLLADLTGAFARITEAPASEVGGHISEAPASWTMEGGHILPEPGEEGAEWYAHAAN